MSQSSSALTLCMRQVQHLGKRFYPNLKAKKDAHCKLDLLISAS